MAREVDYKKEMKHPVTGEAMLDGGGSITIQALMYASIANPLAEDKDLGGPAKMKLYSISHKIAMGKQLKAEELLKVRERAAKGLSILAYGFVNTEICEALGEPVEE